MRVGVSFDLQQGMEGVNRITYSDLIYNPFFYWSCQMDHKGFFFYVLLALKQNSNYR